MKDYFKYNNGEEVTKGAFRISASQVSKFFDFTSEWYRNALLNETTFAGNTATVLGNCVHAGAEMYVDNALNINTIENYVLSVDNPDVDNNEVLENFEPMINALIPYIDNNMPYETEKFIFHHFDEDVGVGGSIDALMDERNPNGVIITDWKTTGSKTPPRTFPRAYFYQQMTYAWVLRQQGTKVSQLRLVYITKPDVNRTSEKTGKPLKDYPASVHELVHLPTEEDYEIIESSLRLIYESVKIWNTQPEMRHILAQDMRLKERKKINFKGD